MANLPGSIWIDGLYLCFTDSTGTNYRYTPTYSGTTISTAIIGSMWIDGQYLYYIDANQVQRGIPVITVGTVTGAIIGSLWLDANRLHWIGGSNTHYYGYDDYSDSAYSDNGHSDSQYQTNISYSDTHTDTYNGPHVDTYHSDSNHSDLEWVHSDSQGTPYSDHSDYRTNPTTF